MTSTSFRALALGLVLFAVAPSADARAGSGHRSHDSSTSNASSTPDIVDLAVGAGSFETLVAAVQAAGLVDALKGDGPFTVFAPTDEAFAALGDDTLASLLEPENRDRLVAILTYHVVAGEVPAAVAITLDSGTTLNGQRVDVAYDGSTLRIDEATVVQADLRARNGVVHVIDRVLLPEDRDLVEVGADAGSFATLAAALDAAGLIEALQGEGPFTVFAPTDAAFAALGEDTIEALLRPENRDQLVDVLTYHVVEGRVYADGALSAGTAATLQGGEVSIGIRDGAARVNDARLLTTDVEASNGVIHVIDRVLMPEDGLRAASAAERLIEGAIERGAPRFNRGDPGACAAIYATAAEGLLAIEVVPATSKQILERALRRAGRTRDASDQAWILRDALDAVYTELGEMHTAMNR